MDYLVRFSQSHETFRLPELESLAVIEGIDLKVISYSLEVSPSLPSTAPSLPHPLDPSTPPLPRPLSTINKPLTQSH